MSRRGVSLTFLSLWLAGCSVGPDYQQPSPQTPTHWNDPGDKTVASQAVSQAVNPRWWTSFQ